MNTSKTLVAYFSCTGTTKGVAQDLATTLRADLFEIEPATRYTSKDLDWRDSNSRSTIEMKDKNSRPEIASKVEDMAQYDTVFIGFPVWWYIAPTIINTFIEAYSFDGKTVILFATSCGSGIENCEKNMQLTYPSIKWGKGKLLNKKIDEQFVDAWIKSIELE